MNLSALSAAGIIFLIILGLLVVNAVQQRPGRPLPHPEEDDSEALG